MRIAFGGQVLPAVGTTKWHTTDDEAFHHAENVDDFAVVASSQDGTIPRLAGLNVPIIDAYAGADGTFIEQLAATGIDGLVISALGSGNVPATMATTCAPSTYRCLSAPACRKVECTLCMDPLAEELIWRVKVFGRPVICGRPRRACGY